MQGEQNQISIKSNQVQNTESVSSQPLSNMSPPQSLGNLPNQSPQSLETELKNLKVKRKIPKKAIFLVGLVVLVLAGLALVLMKFRTSTPSLFGTKGEIVWWGIQHDSGVYQSLIDEFQKQNPDIKIIYQKQSLQDYRERLASALAGGRGPDIFEIHNSWVPMFRDNLSVLPRSVMSKEEYATAFYPVVVSNLTLSKGIVGMPLEYDALTLFINEDIFASSLKIPPGTWNELKSMVDPQEKGSLTIKDKEKRILQSGVALGETANVDHWPEILTLMMYQNRVNPAKPSGQEMSDVLTFYTDFAKLEAWDSTLPPSTNAFAKGVLAMYFAPSRRASDIVKLNPFLRFKTVKLPQLPKNTPTDPNYSYATYWAQGVWEKSSDKDASWAFLKFLAERASLERINQNIKRLETFERAFPRPEMNISLRDDSVVGSVIELALDARTWYMADATNDGSVGLNTQLKNAFGQTIGEWKEARSEKPLEDLVGNVNQIMQQYGISSR